MSVTGAFERRRSLHHRRHTLARWRIRSAIFAVCSRHLSEFLWKKRLRNPQGSDREHENIFHNISYANHWGLERGP
jgi:hypothetical protein